MTALAFQLEEADTRMMDHLHNIFDVQPQANISFRSNDTYFRVFLIYHVHHMHISPKIWMDAGLSGINIIRYIHISQLVLFGINPTSIDWLPVFHSFTGFSIHEQRQS